MAGFYPDVPAQRIAYDTDGTVIYSVTSNVPTLIGSGTVTSLNNESNNGSLLDPGGSGDYFGFLFPTPIDLKAYFVRAAVGSGSTGAVQVSSDTTNLIDGTWTQIAASWGNTASITPTYRTAIVSATSNGIKALRFKRGGGGTFAATNVHLYGLPSGATDRLDFWDPVLDQILGSAALDFGDVPQGNVQTKSFRIKNQSSTLTANSINISDSVLTDASPTLPPQYDYSSDGGTSYNQTLNIGNLAPNAISGTILVRKSTPSNAALSVHAVRIGAQATSWS